MTVDPRNERRCSRLDHCFHQFEGVQVPAKSSFGVGNHRGKPLNSVLAFGVMDLVRADQRLIHAMNEIRNTVGRIQTLIGIHLPESFASAATCQPLT